MEFFDVVSQRCSMRAYTDQPVEREKLQQILECINAAPSAGNLQGYEVYLVTKPELRAALAKASGDQEFVEQAPLVLVFCAHPARSVERYGERGVRLYSVQDATIACTFAMLAATALGLSTVWVGAFDDGAVSRAIDLPEEHIPVALLPVGYAGKQPHYRPRRDLSDLVHEVK